MKVERAVRGLGARQQGLVTAAALARLVPRSSISGALVAGRVVQVRPRVYALQPLPPLPARVGTGHGPDPVWVAHVRAAVLSVAGSATTGRTAAALRGWELLVEPGRTVEVAVAHGRGSVRGPWLRVAQVRGLVIQHVVALPAPSRSPSSNPSPTSSPAACDCRSSRPSCSATAPCAPAQCRCSS